MEKVKSQQLIVSIVKLAKKHDCNSGEMLENHTKFFKLCYGCLKPDDEIKHGLCLKCGSDMSDDYYNDDDDDDID